MVKTSYLNNLISVTPDQLQQGEIAVLNTIIKEHIDAPNAILEIDNELMLPDLHKPSDEKKKDGFIHLVTDAIKGMISTPPRGVELVFSPKTAAGLKDGTYYLVKTSSGTSTVARKVGGNIVEHGKIVEVGKFKQLVGGSYQLLSVVVAQSHLADINKNLEMINKKLDYIIQRMDNADKAKITTIVDWSKEKLQLLSANRNITLSEVEKNQIGTFEIRLRDQVTQITNEIESLNEEVKKFRNSEWRGTKDTNDQLWDFIEKRFFPLKVRYGLLIEADLALRLLVDYINLGKCVFRVGKVDFSNFETSAKLFIEYIKEKSETELKSKTETEETLNGRKKAIAIFYQDEKETVSNIVNERKNRLEMIETFMSKQKNLVLELDENSNIKRYGYIAQG